MKHPRGITTTERAVLAITAAIMCAAGCTTLGLSAANIIPIWMVLLASNLLIAAVFAGIASLQDHPPSGDVYQAGYDAGHHKGFAEGRQYPLERVVIPLHRRGAAWRTSGDSTPENGRQRSAFPTAADGPGPAA